MIIHAVSDVVLIFQCAYKQSREQKVLKNIKLRISFFLQNRI